MFNTFLGTYWAILLLTATMIIVPVLVAQEEASPEELYKYCEDHKGISDVKITDPWSLLRFGDFHSVAICKDGHVVGIK